MIDKKIEDFLQKADMNFMFCLLAKLEAGRLSQLPIYVRNRMGKKLAVLSMEHVADNQVPDYLSEIAEAEYAMSQVKAKHDEDDGSEDDLQEEIIDDSILRPDDPKPEPLDSFDEDDETDDSFEYDDDDDGFDDDDDDKE